VVILVVGQESSRPENVMRPEGLFDEIGCIGFSSPFPSTLESPKYPEYHHRMRLLAVSSVKPGVRALGIPVLGEKRNSNADL